jgi:signal transduction histidine kinase
MVRNFSDPTGSVGAESEFKVIAETAHARMAHVLDSMLDGFALYDADDRLVFYNHNFIDLNPGIADILKPGMRHEDLVKESVARGGINTMGMAPQQYVQWRMHQHFNPGEPHEHEISDGRWIRILEQQNPDGSTTSTQSDITEIKKREIEHLRISGALDERNDQFNFAINHMIQGLCMFDEDQKLLLCNRQYLDMYGFSTEVVKPGITLSDIMMYSISLGNYHERDEQAAVKARHDPDKLKKRTTIKQHLRDGRVMAVMNEPMENGGSIATYQDITIVEKHEATLLEYTKKLERSNRELQDFAHVASHDLQEPLRKIEAFGDRLATKHGDILPDDGKMFVERMQNAATRMRQLINDLLDYSRVTTQAKPFVKVDIGEVLEGVLSDLQVQLQESSGKIEYADMPTIDAEKTQMRQLFQNLLSNALKFRKPDRDPVIKITATKHSGEADGRRAYWEFRLADNGIGFDNAYKDQIFTIFQRLHGRTEFEGTGIGLATVRKIIERHEGTIDADGVPDVGATFIIQLPECQEQHEDNAA